jgi:hypothetical protein
MQLLVQRQIHRAVRLHRQRIDSRREPAKLRALRSGRHVGEQDCGLRFERLADDVVAFDVLLRRNPHTGARTRPAFKQPLEFEAKQRLGDGQKAHAELRGQPSSRDRLTEHELSPRDALAHDAVGFAARLAVSADALMPAGGIL